jgi:hypothetical protein
MVRPQVIYKAFFSLCIDRRLVIVHDGRRPGSVADQERDRRGRGYQERAMTFQLDGGRADPRHQRDGRTGKARRSTPARSKTVSSGRVLARLGWRVRWDA